MDRQLALGVTTAGTGTALLLALHQRGSLRHPEAAAANTQLSEFAAIAVALALVTVGVVVALGAFVVTDAEP